MLAIALSSASRRRVAMAVDFSDRPLKQAHKDIEQSDSVQAIIEKIEQAIEQVLPDSQGRLLAIGVGVPGLVNPGKGIAVHYKYISDWQNVALAAPLAKKFGVPVYLENNARSMALAELFTVHPTLDRQYVADGSLAQLLTVTPLLNNKLVLKLVGNLQISDADTLVGPTLDPPDIKPPPDDAAVIASLRRAAAALDAAAGDGQDASSSNARRLAKVLTALAAADPTRRSVAQARLIPGLKATLAQLSQALLAGPVTLKTLPPELVSDWVSKDGRARIQVLPRGNVDDNAALRRFADAILKVAPDATGRPISISFARRRWPRWRSPRSAMRPVAFPIFPPSRSAPPTARTDSSSSPAASAPA